MLYDKDKAKIIELYNRVQEIPFYCLKNRDPNLLLKRNKGSCSEKHMFLGKELEKLGIPVKYVLIKFDWNDLPVPKEIIRKKDDSVGCHLALKINVGDKWVFVDATWDPKLGKAGFPVTRKWDGKSDTTLAVPPKEIIELNERPPISSMVTEDREFFKSLNKWLDLQRI